MDILELQSIVFKIADECMWYESEVSDANHIIEESEEAKDAIVQRIASSLLTPDKEKRHLEEAEDELADIIFMVLSFSKRYGYSIERGIARSLDKLKMRMNEHNKYEELE